MKLRQPEMAKLLTVATLRNTADLVAIDLLRIVHRAGWPALVAGILFIASLCIVFSATRPMRDEIAVTELQRRQLRTASRSKATVPFSPQARLREFYAAFPPRSALPETLMTLHEVAKRYEVRDTRAEYRDTLEAGTPLVRVKIEIPVSGSYAAIRSWIAELLKTLPTLTLNGLELRRANIGSPHIEARVHFQLLLRNAP